MHLSPNAACPTTAPTRNDPAALLQQWLAKAEAGASPDMKGFAQGVRQDEAAVLSRGRSTGYCPTGASFELAARATASIVIAHTAAP
jgi:hypothetical protein